MFVCFVCSSRNSMEFLRTQHEAKTLQFNDIQAYLNSLFISRSRIQNMQRLVNQVTPGDIQRQNILTNCQKDFERRACIDIKFKNKLESLNLKRRATIDIISNEKITNIEQAKFTFQEIVQIYDQKMEIANHEYENQKIEMEAEKQVELEQCYVIYQTDEIEGEKQCKILSEIYNHAKTRADNVILQ